MSILHSHQRFLLAAISPWIFSISVISSIYFLHSHFGIYAMAVGLLVGGIAQMCILLCSVKQLNYIILPAFSFKDAAFLSILRKWVPILLTSSVFAVNQQIAFFFASGLQDGSGSALSNALVFWQLPFGIFSVSITTVLFSVMSREVAHGNVSAAKTAFTNGIRQLLFLLPPAGTILLVLGKEIITVALQRGLFEYKDTILTAKVLAGYSPGLFTVAAFVLTQRFFYAQNNHTKPIFAAFLVVTIDILLSIILKRTALQVIGLSIANTVAFSVGFILLLAMTKIPFRQWKHIITAFWKSAFVSLLVFTLISFLRMILDNNGLLVSNISDLTAFIRLSILCISAVFCILVSYFILGIRPASLLIKGEKI